MIDEERIKQEQHWKNLAQQLGLEVEPEPTSSLGKGRESSPPPAGKVDKSVSEPPSSHSAPILAEQRPAPPSAHRPQEKVVREVPHAHPSLPREAEGERFKEPAPVPEPVEQAEPRFPERRPRGRRPARASEEAATQAGDRPTVETGIADEAPAGNRGDLGRRRGRGRSRTRKTDLVEETEKEIGEPEREVEAETAPPFPQEPEEEEPEEDLEEVDTLSDWNVPSWNDLIASLYRPDR